VSAVDRLRTSLADDPETWSPALRMIAEAVLESADPARMQQALDVHHERESEQWSKALHKLLTAPSPDARWVWPEEGLVEHTLAVAAEHQRHRADEWIDAQAVPPGSVVEHDPTDDNTVTVRTSNGQGWHCDGVYGLRTPRSGWDWEGRGFDHARVLASHLTTEECLEVSALNADQARAWCARRREAGR
jgi:hypothetical protein